MHTDELKSFMREKARILLAPGHYFDTYEISGYQGLHKRTV